MAGNIFEIMMGVLGLLIAPIWLWLVRLSVNSGVVWGWASGPTRSQKPALFWLVMVAYLALAVGFAWHGLARL
jgi:hypothetical protein